MTATRHTAIEGLRQDATQADPVISVIVPVWNDAKRIGQCIEALKSQSLRSDLFEIIVVDNGSTDATSSVVTRYPDVVLLHEPRPGSYAARNTGLARARGAYVAFTDSDCIPHANWLEHGLAALQGRADVGIVAGRVMFCEPTGPYDRACLNYERHLSMRQEENARNGLAITANWFSRKDLLLKNGGFDAALRSGGDHELSRRISKTGLRTEYLPAAVVMHPPRTHVAEVAAKVRRVAGGRWASATGRFRLLKRVKMETSNLVRRSWTIARAKNLSVYERVEVMALLLRLWMVSLAELLRLQFGGVPTRS
jgi:glycosyltransferase involved in cell wall biosynthesis